MFEELWQVCGQSSDDEERALGGREPVDHAGSAYPLVRIQTVLRNPVVEGANMRKQQHQFRVVVPTEQGEAEYWGGCWAPPGLFTFLDGIGYMDVCCTAALQIAITGIMSLHEGCLINQENKK